MSISRRTRIILLAGLVAVAAILSLRDRTLGEALINGAAIALLGGAVLLLGLRERRVAELNGRLEAELAELTLANRIVENSATVIFQLGAGGWPPPLIYVSRNIDRYGYQPDDLTAEPFRWLELCHPEDREALTADIQALAAGAPGPKIREHRFRRADGQWLWFRGETRAVRNDANELVSFEGLLFDVNEVKLSQQKIAHIASHDSLTGLPNRAAFAENLERVFSSARLGGGGFAVLHLDLDRFKDVNDAFGHELGDTVLTGVAHSLRHRIALYDAADRAFLARLGGDEFAVLLRDVAGEAEALGLADDLIQAVSGPHDMDGRDMHVGACVGVALYDDSIRTAGDMLTQADLALYRAKEAGRGRAQLYSGGLEAKVRERVVIAEDLRAALRNGELELHYQPQVDSPSGRIVGAEALLRWTRNARGPIGPEVFVPIAERAGMISALGDYAIRQACSQMARWTQTGVAPPVLGVNISALQLRDPEHLIDTLSQATRRTRVPPDRLELELTESILAEGRERSAAALWALRNLGVSVAIDDFGTGYSSLQYLTAYPVNRIKIAQQFIRDLVGNAENAAIVRATISLARALQLDLVAEGVETAEQAAILAEQGCPIVQGYFFSKPVPAEEMTRLLAKGRFDTQENAERRPPSIRPVSNG